MQEIIEKLDDQIKACIHCGMCLPACPTYQQTGNEGNSPRGRIYLIKDILKGDIEASEKSLEYLDNCLSCFACETVCPSGVEYGNILDYARHEEELSNYDKGLMGFIRKLSFEKILPNRSLLHFIKSFMAAFSWVSDFLAIFIKKLSYLNILNKNFKRPYTKIDEDQIIHSDIDEIQAYSYGERIVSLPLGCVMDTLFNEIHHESIFVLNKFGYHVYIPKSNCCGALAAHSGCHDLGVEQYKQSKEIWAQKNFPLVFNSAGCGAFVKDLEERQVAGDNDFMSYVHERDLQVFDFIELLEKAPNDAFAKQNWKPSIKNKEKLTITYHPACHINHRQGVSGTYLEMLKKIPYLEIKELPDADTCCGSAGLYNIIQPEMAFEVGETKADNIESTGAQIIASANPGCISQIQAHLGDDFKVVHPISLIADYLRD